MNAKDWVDLVMDGLKLSYAPYSGIKVIALAITPDGRYIEGMWRIHP
ncbi:hypothetical protein [Vulcanisaeta souniana]|uniref:Uncharacterized protein n=1 Tax=Vulcanisaeta souniana JCM 11219 TaxID=1293586 RepID=A0A830EKW4_9CREN|nr:hypothetical protein [Vulcanisaeta souniana]BDR93129.1 hypothetical protein Vsou_22220 [Vulcanisaeta souniana JCM 11219]GGI87005.1 hypothetical protein GCM10007112_24890 [Vulcanisaeta souniana JCM 11219]